MPMKLNRLIPMQPVNSMPASVAFYEKLGFEIENRNDQWGWAMLRCGDCRIMLDQSIAAHPGIPRIAVLYLYPEDIVDFHRRASENGLDLPELDATFYGMTEFRIEDPDGNRLWIGQADAADAADSV
ncbi:MAG: hypothetical protein E6Q88_06030 [Lysobacteraceae bacterium]|nr:MAG: hypothetical protein E6Q88_06030 [Xanthomonadaceae bacterium]